MSTTFPYPLPSPGQRRPLPPRPAHVEHWYVRPGWTCDQGCGQWPCQPARVELAAAFPADPVGLAVYMAGLLPHVAAEAGTLLAVDLHALFIAWTRAAECAT